MNVDVDDTKLFHFCLNMNTYLPASIMGRYPQQVFREMRHVTAEYIIHNQPLWLSCRMAINQCVCETRRRKWLSIVLPSSL